MTFEIKVDDFHVEIWSLNKMMLIVTFMDWRSLSLEAMHSYKAWFDQPSALDYLMWSHKFFRITNNHLTNQVFAMRECRSADDCMSVMLAINEFRNRQ